jgi:hypothetical protein
MTNRTVTFVVRKENGGKTLFARLMLTERTTQEREREREWWVTYAALLEDNFDELGALAGINVRNASVTDELRSRRG